MDFLDSWARVLAGLWQRMAACGGRVLPLIITYDLRIEAWKLQSSRPGLMSWLVDLDGLD